MEVEVDDCLDNRVLDCFSRAMFSGGESIVTYQQCSTNRYYDLQCSMLL